MKAYTNMRYHFLDSEAELKEWAWAIQRGVDYVLGKIAETQSKVLSTVTGKQFSQPPPGTCHLKLVRLFFLVIHRLILLLEGRLPCFVI